MRPVVKTMYLPEIKSMTPIKAAKKVGAIEKNVYMSDVTVLQMIGEIHDNLCEASKKLMYALGIQSLVSIAFIFVTTTCQMFYLLVLSESKGALSVTCSSIWLLLYVLPLIVLCGSCHLCATEVILCFKY